MRLPLPESEEYWILRALLIDGRVQHFVRSRPCEAAKLDVHEVRAACVCAVDAIYGKIPDLLNVGEDASAGLESMRRQTRHDGQDEVLQ